MIGFKLNQFINSPYYLHVILAIKYILSTMVGVEKEKSEPKRNET